MRIRATSITILNERVTVSASAVAGFKDLTHWMKSLRDALAKLNDTITNIGKHNSGSNNNVVGTHKHCCIKLEDQDKHICLQMEQAKFYQCIEQIESLNKAYSKTMSNS